MSSGRTTRSRTSKGDPGLSVPVSTRRLGKGDWSEVVELFGKKGACGGCWCMWWRVPRGGRSWEEAKGKKNRDRFRRLVKGGNVHAVIAESEGAPVGWCSFGPRSSFPRLANSPSLVTDWSTGTWSIICFYLLPRWRLRGLGTRLLQEATKVAFSLGGSEIEAYPAVPKKTPMPGAFAWTGVPAMFRKAGYKRMRRTTGSRPIYIRTHGD